MRDEMKGSETEIGIGSERGRGRESGNESGNGKRKGKEN